MYIEPNTVVRMLSGVPLDETYDHTLYFANATAQANYFISKTKYTYTENTYQRHSKGSIRIAANAESLFDCNYIMFRNTNFGSKWFYGFVTNVEYLNNDVCVVSYVLDDMQTWAFDYELEQCFVEREHSVTDVIGEHTVPEGLELGGYITTSEFEYNITEQDKIIMILATEVLPDFQTNWNVPILVSGAPINCYWYPVICHTESEFQIGLQQVNAVTSWYSSEGKADAIIAIYVAPKLLSGGISGYAEKTNMNVAPRTLSTTVKNNKLYTYPYCCLSVLAGAQVAELKYELFTEQPKLGIINTYGSPSSGTSVVPLFYGGYDTDYSSILNIKGYPMLCWINDYYQNWLAQNESVINASYIKAATSIYTGLVAGSAAIGTGSVGLGLAGISMIGAGLNQINQTMAEVEKHSVMPDTLGGSIDSVNLLFAARELSIRTYCRTIRPEYVKMIDDYFNRFGYKTNLNKIPNTHSRPHWNYVKTISCTVKGNMPADSLRHICQIFDNGITFWKNPSEVGNYSLDNRPT